MTVFLFLIILVFPLTYYLKNHYYCAVNHALKFLSTGQAKTKNLGDMQFQRITYKKIVLMTALFVLGGCLLVYFFTSRKVDTKFKNQQNKGGSVSISTADLEDDFISLQQGTGTPQTGNLNITGDIQSSGNVQGSSVNTDSLSIGNLNGALRADQGVVSGGATTSDVPEGTNQYYTDAKAREAISGSSPINYNSTTGNISLGNSGVMAGTYGSTTKIGQLTVDNMGRVTSATNIDITPVGTALDNTKIWVGNASNQATAVALSGDVLINNIGLTTIQPGAVDILTDTSGTLSVARGGTGASDAAGAKTNLGLDNVDNVSLLGWTGSTNLATVGTITTGTWNAGAVTSSGAISGTSFTATGLTQGSVAFAGAGGLISQDNASLFWNNTDKRLGIGTATPTTQLHVAGKVPTAEVGHYDIAGTLPYSVFVQGKYAYVSYSNGGYFRVFDVSNPASITLVGSLQQGSTSGLYVYVQGKYAYTADNSFSKLRIIDISNPTAPVYVGYASTGGGSGIPRTVYVQGRYAYVTNQGTNNFEIFDVSDPTAPYSVSTTATTGTGTHSVYVQGRYAYVVNNYGTTYLDVFDVSNPASPSLVGSEATGQGGPHSIYVQGRYAYTVNRDTDTFQVFDVYDPAAPSLIATVAAGDGPRSVYVQERYAYVANSLDDTFQVFDVSNPASPTSLGTVAAGDTSRFVYVQGRYAYVICEGVDTGIGKLQIFDLGGAYIQQLETGGLDVGTAHVQNNIVINNDASVAGGLSVSRGVDIIGASSMYSTDGAAGLKIVQGGSNYAADILSNKTAQTASNRVINIANTGATFDTTAGALSSYGGYFNSTSTRSAGANNLTNIGVYASASGAQNNYAAIFDSGNVGIGTTAPSSKLTIKTAAADEAGALGSELTDSTGWTFTGWTGSYGAGFTHTAGNTNGLSRNVGAGAGNSYYISWTVTGRTAGSFRISLGGVESGQSGNSDWTASGNLGTKASGSGNLIFIPTTDFDGTISNISVKQITTYGPTVRVEDSTSAVNIAIRSSSASSNNTFIGVSSGQYNVSGTQNTALGVGALMGNTTGTTNTAVGYNALAANTSGMLNTAVGWNALAANTSSEGYANTALGTHALMNSTTGKRNTAIGVMALQNNTTGYENTTVGTHAGDANTTGYWNVAMGMQTLMANSTGYGNTALGTRALSSNTANYNTAVGTSALQLGSTGTGGTAVGVNALYNNTANYNTAVGQNALKANTSGYWNTAIGRNALGGDSGGNTTGYYNVALGYGAGVTSTAANANTTGNKNVYIGVNAGPGTSTQYSNSIAIGYNALVSQSNSMVLGGTGADAVNVGIGTTAPTNKLEIDGEGYTGKVAVGVSTADPKIKMYRWTGTAELYYSTYFVDNGLSFSLQTGSAANRGSETPTTRLTVQRSTGNVGIGSTATTPGARLQVDTEATGTVGQIIKAYAGQTADLLQIQGSDASVLAKIDASGNLTAKAASFTGTLTVNGHIITGNTSGSTTIAAGANVGASPTLTITGNDTSGTFSITTGTGSGAGALGVVTFANAYGANARVVVTPTNANAAGLQNYVTSGTTTFTLNTGNAPVDATQYTYNYVVMQ